MGRPFLDALKALADSELRFYFEGTGELGAAVFLPLKEAEPSEKSANEHAPWTPGVKPLAKDLVGNRS